MVTGDVTAGGAQFTCECVLEREQKEREREAELCEEDRCSADGSERCPEAWLQTGITDKVCTQTE